MRTIAYGDFPENDEFLKELEFMEYTNASNKESTQT